MKSESTFKTIESTTYILDALVLAWQIKNNNRFIHFTYMYLQAIMIYAPNVAKLFNEF